ncbi:hypothetical protein ACJIZ3_021570 [Penstemon smallii]|uniref:Reverse transcriptase domain-containing protein n=1 Tax=Penstemon smallii TaxID=265156 RepID=A0ABD3SMC2_9LAMI
MNLILPTPWGRTCNPMRTLAWNCQGLGKPKAGRALRELLKNSKPDILFLSEIKTSSTSPIINILNFAHLSNHIFVPPIGIAGGLCLAWTSDTNVQVLSMDATYIDAMVTTDQNSTPWHLTGADLPYPSDLENLFPNVVNEEENNILCKIPSPKEIKQVMFSFASEKSPGPDGLPALFYKYFWSTTGITLVHAVRHFFKSGFMLKAINHTFVTLIPKIANASRVEHFRPISLCNISYKVISKIIANRLKPLLQKIISPNQMAFVEGRSINENTIISHEIMHYLHNRKGKKGFLAIKVDLSKAYDRVEWKLLLHILHCLGFCEKFVSWIKQCISSCNFSFLINGIRQGDPLSPYLFIIYTELLSRLLVKEESIGSFRGIKIARTCPLISHLLYADDLIIYCRANLDDVHSVFKILEKFSTWSGQIVNTGKSFIHFSRNVDNHFNILVENELNLRECDHNSKHLGLPFCKKRSRSQAFNDIIVKLQQKLNGWRSKNLSHAGRGILVKAVAQALPMYPMSTFLIPKTICDTLDKIMRKFWWGENSNGNSLMLKTWTSICLPKALGGLGFRKSEDFNRALVSKLTWKMANNENCLWTKVMEAKYLKGKNFFDVEKAPNNASWIWRDIFNCKDIILKGICTSINVESSVQIWKIPWIPSLPGTILTPKPDCLVDLTNFSLVRHLICPSRGDWDIDILSELFSPEIIFEIRKIIISPPTSPQRLFWHPSKSGNFSSKSAYLTSQISRFPNLAQNDSTLFKNIWNSKIHNRHKLFVWKTIHDIIPTKKRLSCFLQIDNSGCPICNTETESLDHLFLRCPLSVALWFHSPWNFRVEAFQNTPIRDWIALLLCKDGIFFPSPKLREDFFIFAVCLFDTIWYHRNQIVHNGLVSPFQVLLQRIKSSAAAHVKAQIHTRFSASFAASKLGWKPPEADWISANVDASFKDGKAAWAIIFRNHLGSILFAKSAVLPCLNVAVAEAIALKEACSAASSCGVFCVNFESDCLTNILAVTRTDDDLDWDTSILISEIRSFWTSWPKWKFNFISRNANRAAHNLAAWTFSTNSTPPLSPTNLPISIFCDGGFPCVNWNYSFI